MHAPEAGAVKKKRLSTTYRINAGMSCALNTKNFQAPDLTFEQTPSPSHFSVILKIVLQYFSSSNSIYSIRFVFNSKCLVRLALFYVDQSHCSQAPSYQDGRIDRQYGSQDPNSVWTFRHTELGCRHSERTPAELTWCCLVSFLASMLSWHKTAHIPGQCVDIGR